MLTSVEGIYRNGKVELAEQPISIANDTRVIVTFLHENEVDLRAYRIDETNAADLRMRFATFADDWNAPEMDAYDNYDAAKSTL